MRRIELTQGYVALVDNEDYQRVSQFKWYADIKRTRLGTVRTVYASHKTNGVMLRMHNLILDMARVDHKDSNGLDNRRKNLRKATQTQNTRNQRIRIDNTSGYKGVYWATSKQAWKSHITVGGTEKFLGYFPTAKQAALAYDAKARELFGEFAHTNFKEVVNPPVHLGRLPSTSEG